MKQITAYVLAAGVVSLGMAGQASASHLSPVVNKANNLRKEALRINKEARHIDYLVRCMQMQGRYWKANKLKNKARKMRRKATSLARASNRVARSAFRMGYHRPNHSHSLRASYRYHA